MTNNENSVVAASPLDSIYGENPLLTPLGPRIAFQHLPHRLTNRPLNGHKLASLDASSREELLVLYEQNFVPTTSGIDIVAALQNLHREHYWHRHPANPKVRRDRAQIAQFTKSKDFNPASIPWLSTSARGMIIKGITGTGKTAITNRYTDLLSQQVYEHMNGAIPGFEYVRQVSWIKVDMSNDGSRDGFLTSILMEVDKQLDTNYAKQYSGRFSIDKLAIVVGVILSTHLCGMLIIEEIQEKNFNNSKWRSQLTTFFLRILNFGIPIVLIGNPLGFTELEKSSQNVRRLSSGGVFEMLPSLDGTDDDFYNIVDHTLSFNVMEQQNERAYQHFRSVAFSYSGGITDFVVRLNIESQLIALRSGKSEVLPKHINAAFSGPRMVANHPLINGLVNRDPNMLRTCNDVPVERFLAIWLKEKQRHDTPGTKSGKIPDECIEETNTTSGAGEIAGENFAKIEHPAPPPSEHPLAKRLKAEQTRTANRRKKAVEQKEKLGSDDIRGEGVGASLVAGLKDLLNQRN
ncbi:ATP-binding protein [Massilia aurea]|uniref:ATP-binding protein n=1 Tax=Massilia aurea TaxID=373040 RepID=UPI003462FAA0